MTPSGTPASINNSATRKVDSEASSAGLSTAVHPVASVGPSTHHWLIKGAFHGVMPPTTPTGAFVRQGHDLPGQGVSRRLGATFERAARCLHRQVDVRRVALRETGDDLACGRVDRIEFLARRGSPPLPADQEPLRSRFEPLTKAGRTMSEGCM